MGILDKKYIGGKTIKLKDLTDLGLNVPKFIAIPSNILEESINEKGEIKKEKIKGIKEEVLKTLKCSRYAVRSSALIEDSEKESFAGQFLTKINLTKNDIEQAICEVLTHAYGYLSGEINKFSIIVQEYIEPEFSGITFTRNPSGERNMIIEYHQGIGEDIVGGKIKPKRIEFYWHNKSDQNKLPKLKEAIENFKKIENFYKFPQDIEWCIKNGTWYFLQSRPITTISEEQYAQNLYLDETLPKDINFYYEKTEISEITPRPTPFTLSLLEEIYKKNGPIDKVYNSKKIKYESKNFLKIIGNELYCDREEELKTLLPSYSFLKSDNLTPKFNTFRGIIKTFKNLYFLNKIDLNPYTKIYEKIKTKIEEKKTETDNVLDLIPSFLEDYETVFEANLLSESAIRKLEKFLKRKNIEISSVLNFNHEIVPELSNLKIELKENKLIGNSIEIADESEFSGNISVKEADITAYDKIKGSMKWWEQKYFDEALKYALIYNRLREFGRWLLVRNINVLRKVLIKTAEEKKFKDPRNIYFTKLNELLSGNISEETCMERKEKYLSYDKFNFQKIITSQVVKGNSLTCGISSGIAKGVLVREKDIENKPSKTIDKILYVQVLSPDLVRYFGEIKGIVSESGGLLSHLAIIARERKLPIVVNFSFENSKVRSGDTIEINGETGEIKKLT